MATKKANTESIRKPYRSSAATYEEFKKEIPDDDYYGLKHSEFKRPWLDPEAGYDEMEYKWDFPLPYINPVIINPIPPAPWVYPYPPLPPWNPDWWQPNYNPNFPFPKPRPNPGRRPDPRNAGDVITWDCDAPSFGFCPGEDVTLIFEEAWNNPIIGVVAEGGASATIDGSKVALGAAMGTRTVTVHVPDDFVGSFLKVIATTQIGMTCETTGVENSFCTGTACTGVSIGYTSTAMNVNTSQNLSIVDPKPGVTYEFTLSGGGTLTDTGGGTATYTAPATNPGCANSATIQLVVGGTAQICAELKIEINAVIDGGYYAYITKDDGFCRWYSGAGAACIQIHRYYNCAGVKTFQTEDPTWLYPACNVPPCSDYLHLGCETMPCMSYAVVDLRDAGEIAAGCCPGALV